MSRDSRRWFCLLLVLVCLVGPMAAVAVLRVPPSAADRAILDRIQPGTPRVEVERMLGGPPGDYCHGRTIYAATAIVVPRGQETGDEAFDLAEESQWQRDGLLIVVHFDEADRVEFAFGLLPSRQPWYRLLQRWLPFLGG
jgi:hypothetical protein